MHAIGGPTRSPARWPPPVDAGDSQPRAPPRQRVRRRGEEAKPPQPQPRVRNPPRPRPGFARQRTGWDSNPRGREPTRFPIVRLKPLGHPSETYVATTTSENPPNQARPIDRSRRTARAVQGESARPANCGWASASRDQMPDRQMPPSQGPDGIRSRGPRERAEGEVRRRSLRNLNPGFERPPPPARALLASGGGGIRTHETLSGQRLSRAPP